MYFRYSSMPTARICSARSGCRSMGTWTSPADVSLADVNSGIASAATNTRIPRTAITTAMPPIVITNTAARSMRFNRPIRCLAAAIWLRTEGADGSISGFNHVRTSSRTNGLRHERAGGTYGRRPLNSDVRRPAPGASLLADLGSFRLRDLGWQWHVAVFDDALLAFLAEDQLRELGHQRSQGPVRRLVDVDVEEAPERVLAARDVLIAAVRIRGGPGFRQR